MEMSGRGPVTAETLLKFAVESEQQAENFYWLVADKLREPLLQRVFAEFAEEENRHKTLYAKMAPLSGGEPPSPAQRENLRLMHAYFRSRLFSPEILNEKLRRLTDPAGAYELAVGMELDSMLFYGELRPFIAESDRLRIDEIITEERRHFLRLLRLKDAREI